MLIDLDVVPAEREEPARQPGVASRPVLGGLCLLLVALLAGSAHPAPPRSPVVIPARSSDLTFVRGDRLFIVGGETDTAAQTLRTYRLPDARLLSSTTVAALATVSDVLQAGSTTLLTEQSSIGGDVQTVAVDTDTGEELWRLRAAPIAASATAGIALLSAGYQGSNPTGTAIDLRTGERRWTVSEPVGGLLTSAGYADGLPRWLVSVTLDGYLTSYDARTGERLATATAALFGQISSDLLSADAGQFVIGTSTGTSAYSLPALTPQWRVPAEVTQSGIQTACGPVICTFHQTQGMTALDPATGRTLWTDTRFAYARPAGAYLLATTPEGTVFALGPATGQVRGDFDGWRGLPDPDGLSYAIHPSADRNTLWYGKLDPARATARVLGAAQHVAGQCDIGAGVLVCRRVDAAVAVWQLT